MAAQDKIEVTKERIVPLEKVRNIGIIAHIDAGKTTTTERFLFYTGKSYKIGDIDEGTTVTDWMDQERERGITIVSAAVTTFWKDIRINLIDTPGHIDFTAEVERSLRVLDGAVMVFDAEEGVQSQSETVWHQADLYGVPRLVFINKMDKLGADFDNTVGMIRDRLGARPVVISYPIGKEHDFTGVVLLLEKKAIKWTNESGTEMEEIEIPADLAPKIEKERAKLIEEVCSEDESLMEKYLAGQEPTLEELKKVLRQGVIANRLIPIYAGASLRNKGVQPLLDGVVDFLPSPLDVPPVEGNNPQTGQVEKREPKNDAPFAALAFKVQTDPHVGRLTYLRIYSGTLKSGERLLNSTENETERVGRILLMHANKREEITEAFAGEIVAAIGFVETTTGDTVTDPSHPIVLETITFPEPVISLSIEPKSRADEDKLGIALSKLSEEDPTFKIKSNPETGQTVISGMGELHLEILVDRMKREFNVEAATGAPQVAYKETIMKIAQAEGKYIRQSGGRGQYGHCFLRVEPKGRGEGFEFVSEIRGGAIPGEFIPSIEKGVKEAMEKGVIAGYPLVDMKVAVYDGTYHDVDSSDIAFKIAGSSALQAAVKSAEPTLLEPIMTVEVTTPDEFLGKVIGDLSSRRAKILETQTRGKMRVIKALVPLAGIQGYATVLRSLTQGRASYYMEPSHYEEVPKNIQEELSGAKKVAS